MSETQDTPIRLLTSDEVQAMDVEQEGRGYDMNDLYSQEWWEKNRNGHVWERDAKGQVVIDDVGNPTGCDSVTCAVCGDVFCVKCIYFIGQYANPADPDSMDMPYAGPDVKPCRGYHLPFK